MRSVPEQCLVFGFHISSLVQGVDILAQDIVAQNWLRLPYRARTALTADDGGTIGSPNRSARAAKSSIPETPV
jgi:hypothetical protein